MIAEKSLRINLPQVEFCQFVKIAKITVNSTEIITLEWDLFASRLIFLGFLATLVEYLIMTGNASVFKVALKKMSSII